MVPTRADRGAVAGGGKMGQRACSFKETDLKRALRAAHAAGVRVRVDIEHGKMSVTMVDADAETSSAPNPWDEDDKGGGK
jgi:hypothetical protein